MNGGVSISWGIEALIASAVLMAIVLVIRAPVRRTFGPGIAYALWALPAIRLVLPPLPQLPAWKSAAAAVATPDLAQTLTVYVIEPLGGSAAAPASLFSSLGLPLAVLWGVGAAAFIGWHAISHWRFCRRMIAGSTLSERAGAIDVIETEAASGPLAFGIFRRYVAFPRDFAERYDADERELALLHELGHHQRGDLFANWIALGVLALHWFNPLAWRAFRAFRSDQEMANDARVLAGRSAIDRHTYACAIVKAAHGGAVSAACHLHTINDLKGRLKMLTTGTRSRTRLALGGTAVAALMIVGLAGTASGTAAAASVRAGVEKATGIDIAKFDAKPQSMPPTAPAMPEGAEVPAPPAPPEAAAPPARVKKIKIVKIDKDGNTISENVTDIPDVPDMPELADMPELKNIPDVRSGDCKGGGDATVINKQKGDRRIMMICTNRIQRMASLAADRAMRAKDIQRMSYDRALEGLRRARESMMRNDNLTGEGRRDALDGIDEAIRDMEAERAERD
ncbi:peptidase M56 [Sphingomonas panacisoli]|uniref:Peptidase M56 n=1 Tax=Sphingomonas panacisoli TaxID=1813879 RepID=A0A5B8LH53_9SPHN|nr:M56 family metallopeptidase [Sphingomonas panacisoli]QDZ07095.1 peptidase M56 [Sphingomonas panacisoli]